MRIVSIKRIELDEPVPVYDVINAAPNHNFYIQVGSREIVSHNCFLDEVSFARTKDIKKQVEKAKVVFDAALERIQSRFTKFGGIFDGLIIMASSKRTDQAFAETYTQQLLKGRNSNRVLVVDKPRWEVLPPGTYSGRTFPVAIGDKLRPSEIIKESDVPAYVNAGYRIIRPPIETYDEFQRDMLSALTNIAGESVNAAGSFIAGEHIGACINTQIKNPFRQGVIYCGTKDEAMYQDYFDISRIAKEDLAAPLYIHLDASLGDDGNSISGGRILYAQDQRDKQTGLVQPELHYRQIFKIKVRAPKGDRTMLRKNEQFIFWLREQGFNIAKVTSDQYQCLLKGTLIWTKDGYVPIEHIKKGDVLLSYNIEKQCYEETKAVNVWQSRNEKDFIQVNTSGAGIKVTNDHMFLTTKGYKRADQLKKYDCIKSNALAYRVIAKQVKPEDSIKLNNYIFTRKEEKVKDDICSLITSWGVDAEIDKQFNDSLHFDIYVPASKVGIDFTSSKFRAKQLDKSELSEKSDVTLLTIYNNDFNEDKEWCIQRIFDSLDIDGTLVIDTKPVHKEEEQPFYDIEVESENHNYLTISGVVHNSVQFGQDLVAAGIPYGYLSIDRVTNGINKTYQVLRNTIYEHRIELLNDEDQTQELLHLIKYEDGRVDKPDGGSDDSSQVLCGWVYSASLDKEKFVLNNVVLGETVLGSTDYDRYSQEAALLPRELTMTHEDFMNEFGAYKVEGLTGLRKSYEDAFASASKKSNKDKEEVSPFNFF